MLLPMLFSSKGDSIHLLLQDKIKNTFVFGNIFVAVCAYFLSLEELYFQEKIALLNSTSLFVFFSTLLIYNYRKAIYNEEHLPPKTVRSNWIVANKQVLRWLTILGGIGLILTAYCLSKRTLLFLIPIFLISLFYATPFNFNNTSTIRLRYFPFLKIFLVAGVWAAVTVLFPVFENDFDSFFSFDVIFTFITRFIFLFAITLPFDIRDMEVDQQSQIKTIPVVFGKIKANNLALLLLLLFIVLYVLRYYFSHKPNNFLNIGYIASGFLAVLLVYWSRKRTGEYFIAFWIEGLMLFQFLLILVADFILT